MNGKKRGGRLKKFLADESSISTRGRGQQDLSYVETATRFGIISEPYSAEARDRDLAWLEDFRNEHTSFKAASQNW